MNYWITTHWPPHEIDFAGSVYCGVWLQEGRQHVATEMKRGDLVFKYESLTGLPRKKVLPDGRTVIQRCRRGHMGIIALMEVTGELYQTGETPQEYTDGSQRSWRYHADAVCKDTDGFVSLVELNTLLGYSEENRLRGFGDAHSGLKRIDKTTFDKIYTLFKQGT